MTRRRRSGAVIEAGRRGRDAGHTAATWIDFGEASARRFLQGWDDGDPAIMDQYAAPSWWRSGGWYEQFIGPRLGDMVADDPDHEEEILAEYEIAADEAYWKEVQRAALAQLPRRRKRNPPRMLNVHQRYL